MADRGALDAAITSLGNDTSSLVALVQNLITKAQANAAAPIDFSSEVAELNTIQGSIDAALTNANAAASAPVVSQTAPVSTPPTAASSASPASPSTSPSPSSSISSSSSAPQTATGASS